MSAAGNYIVRIKRSAEREMGRLPSKPHERVAQIILSLERDPRPRGCKKLAGVEQYRLRAGDYRILYTVEDRSREVEVVAVGHRRDVYHGL